MLFLQIIGCIFFILIIYLIIIIFFPVMKEKRVPFKKNPQPLKLEPPACREDVIYYAGLDKINGWLYLPKNAKSKVPCIILNHGFGGTKDALLENYALRFCEAGYGVLAYDYRHYGDSEGHPRQIYSAGEQLDDLRMGIKYVQSRIEIDENKIIIWGASAGANYGIVMAAENPSIAGVISQCGSYDHKEDNKLYYKRDGYGMFLGLFAHAQRDKGRSRFGLSRHIIPAYGKGSMFQAFGVFEGVQRIAENSENFINEVCAAFIFTPHGPDILEIAKKVNCPVLLQVCEKDEIVSPRSHIRLAEILQDKATVKTYPIGHFDIYFDDDFEKAIGHQLSFLQTVIKP